MPRPSTYEGGIRKLGATIRLELLSPNTSFRVKPVNNLPILKTPLSVQVSEMQRNRYKEATGPQFCSRYTGFLTLSNVRQAVLLTETDPDSSSIPLVGAWIYVDTEAPSITANSSLTENILIWSACCRYFHSSHIKERVWIAPDTFLLVTR